MCCLLDAFSSKLRSRPCPRVSQVNASLFFLCEMDQNASPLSFAPKTIHQLSESLPLWQRYNCLIVTRFQIINKEDQWQPQAPFHSLLPQHETGAPVHPLEMVRATCTVTLGGSRLPLGNCHLCPLNKIDPRTTAQSQGLGSAIQDPPPHFLRGSPTQHSASEAAFAPCVHLSTDAN